MAVNISDTTRVVATNDVAFFVGDAADYTNAATISSDGIYFIRDTGSIYRGGREYGAGHIAVQDGLAAGYTNVNDTYEDVNISTYGQPGIVKPNTITFKVNSDGRLDLKHLPSNVINSSLWYESSTNNNIPDAIKKYVTTIHHLKREIVTKLPDKGDEDTIYMLQNTERDDPGTDTDNYVNYYDEYMYINGKWELIGDSRTVLKDYAYIKNAVMRNRENGDVQTVIGGLYLKSTGDKTAVGTLQTAGGITVDDGDINLNSSNNHTVHNVSNPQANNDAANKWYVDDTSDKARKKAETNIVKGFSSPSNGQVKIKTDDGGEVTVTITGWNDLTTKVNNHGNRLDTLETKTIPGINTNIKDLQNADTIVTALYSDEDYKKLDRTNTKGVVTIVRGGGIDVDNGAIKLCSPLPKNVVVSVDNIKWTNDQGIITTKIPAESIITTGDNSLQSWVLQKISEAGHLSYEIIPDGKTLSSITEPDTHTVYLLKQSAVEDKNYYDEYMYINSKWELIGDSRAILNGYITEAQSDKKYIQPSELSFSKGSTNGAFNVSVKGVSTSVSVCGLTSTAYTDKSYFAAATDLNWNELSS